MPIEISNLFLSFGIDLKSCLKKPNENSAPYVKEEEEIFSPEIKSEMFEKVNENSIDDDNAYLLIYQQILRIQILMIQKMTK